MDGDGPQDHVGRVLGEGERISISQALHAVTLGAAYLLGQDDKKGSIAAGKLADFTILDRNPLQVASPDGLKAIKVLGTVMGGKPFPVSVGRWKEARTSGRDWPRARDRSRAPS